MRDECDEREIATSAMHVTMRDERDARDDARRARNRDDARRARGATMRDERDECEIATGDKTALQSLASWWGFLFG